MTTRKTDGGRVAVLTRISGRDRLDVRRGYRAPWTVGATDAQRALPAGDAA